MTVRPGQYGVVSQAASTPLGSAAGINLGLSNSAWAVIVAFNFLFSTTATVGNRALSVVLDSAVVAGNVLFRNACTPISASQVVRVCGAAGLPNQSIAVPLIQILGYPVEMPLPPLAAINIFDSNNVDVNDAVVSLQVSFAM